MTNAKVQMSNASVSKLLTFVIWNLSFELFLFLLVPLMDDPQPFQG
jgi:hypothetical protein